MTLSVGKKIACAMLAVGMLGTGVAPSFASRRVTATPTSSAGTATTRATTDTASGAAATGATTTIAPLVPPPSTRQRQRQHWRRPPSSVSRPARSRAGINIANQAYPNTTGSVSAVRQRAAIRPARKATCATARRSTAPSIPPAAPSWATTASAATAADHAKAPEPSSPGATVPAWEEQSSTDFLPPLRGRARWGGQALRPFRFRHSSLRRRPADLSVDPVHVDPPAELRPRRHHRRRSAGRPQPEGVVRPPADRQRVHHAGDEAVARPGRADRLQLRGRQEAPTSFVASTAPSWPSVDGDHLDLARRDQRHRAARSPPGSPGSVRSASRTRHGSASPARDRHARARASAARRTCRARACPCARHEVGNLDVVEVLRHPARQLPPCHQPVPVEVFQRCSVFWHSRSYLRPLRDEAVLESGRTLVPFVIGRFTATLARVAAIGIRRRAMPRLPSSSSSTTRSLRPRDRRRSTRRRVP